MPENNAITLPLRATPALPPLDKARREIEWACTLANMEAPSYEVSDSIIRALHAALKSIDEAERRSAGARLITNLCSPTAA